METYRNAGRDSDTGLGRAEANRRVASVACRGRDSAKEQC